MDKLSVDYQTLANNYRVQNQHLASDNQRLLSENKQLAQGVDVLYKHIQGDNKKPNRFQRFALGLTQAAAVGAIIDVGWASAVKLLNRGEQTVKEVVKNVKLKNVGKVTGRGALFMMGIHLVFDLVYNGFNKSGRR